MDLTLFKEKSYDYARSISSVRYGLSSALYSLVLGSIAAAGQYLVLRSASSPYGQTLTIAGWAVVGGVAALLFYALYRRRLDSSAEYDARLNLIVLSSLELARIEEGEPEVSELQVNITELAAAAENPVAVFDLDNTLLIGDVQEALLARLSRAGRLRGFRWSEYVGMLETDHQRALRMAVEALDGHTLSSIEQETRALLVENESKLVVQGCEILMPKPHPVLQRLVAQLQMSGIECLVISASNQISVEVLSWELFGIPKRNVVGIRSTIGHRLLRKCLSRKLIEPVPVYEGKGEALAALPGDVTPVLVAGDSPNDYAMLRKCHEAGLILWVGNDPAEAESVGRTLRTKCRVQFVRRRGSSKGEFGDSHRTRKSFIISTTTLKTVVIPTTLGDATNNGNMEDR